jgi:uncharacterized Zn finger protein (UPF0148 family)
MEEEKVSGPVKNPCVKMNYSPGMFRGRACGLPGKIKVKGEWYCGIHDPIKREAKAKARQEKFEAEWKAEEAHWDWEKKYKEARAEVLQAARNVFSARPIISGAKPPTKENDLAALKKAVETLDQVEKEKPSFPVKESRR